MLIPAFSAALPKGGPLPAGPWYYARSAQVFLEDAENPYALGRLLADAHRRRWRESPADGEVRSWEHSAAVLQKLLEEAHCTREQMVVLEYCLWNAGRIDALLCGVDRRDRLSAVLLELKRWQKCTIEESATSRSVRVDFGHGFERRAHPSVQVLGYRSCLQEVLEKGARKGAERVRLSAYAYLHNCSPVSENIANMRRVLFARKFRPYLHAAPLFLEEHGPTLRRKIERRIEKGGGESVLRRLVQ